MGLQGVAEAHREAALVGSEVLFHGLEHIAEAQTHGFSEMSTAIKDGNLLQAISTWASARGLSQADSRSIEALKDVLAERIGQQSGAERRSSATHVVRLLDVTGRVNDFETT